MSEYIGVYRLESPLGQGGMGEVFLAWDERLERRVAIKRVRQDAFLLSRQRELFRREARMAARLSHSAIVQIHDLVTDDSGDAIVMEYVEGTTLAERMAQGLLDTAEAVRLAREIAEGLAAAHAAGLIHRDLKAENVIVTPSGHAKILDFGLARPVSGEEEPLTRHGAVIGTSHAMSPEQAGGEELDERSDLFSLGVLLREMLTGRSPFLGKSSLGNLRRVLTEQPPPLASVRPDIPHRLASLADGLLAKHRDQRPRSAEQVARKLERIERELAAVSGRPGPTDDSVGEMSTAAFPVLPWMSGAAPSSATSWTLPRRARLLTALILLAVLAMTAAHLLTRRSSKPEPLRVIVVKPEVAHPEDEGLSLTASGVLAAALHGLGGLEGIAALDPTLVAGSVTSPLQAARNVAADEVLVSTVQKEGRLARVSLRRVRAEGQVLWSDSWVVPTDPGGLRLLADLVAGRLRSAYPGLPPRRGAPPRLQVRDDDYSAFLEIRQRIDSGKAPTPSDLEQLDSILQRSPRFLEGWIQAAKLAIARFRSTHEPDDLERARSYVDGARQIAPDDPRTLRESFMIALLGQRHEEAGEILGRIEEQFPGDPDVLFLRYRLLESQDRGEEAGEALRAAAERAPSWRNIYWLANFETRRGRIREARGLLEGLLRQSPGNVWALEQLAYLEMVYGDLERAERAYDELARSDPRPSHFTNLGVVRSLRRHYPQAREAYGHALELQPADVNATLNLADSERSLGNRVAAKALYGAVLRRLDDREAASGLQPEELMIRAQCLGHLGRSGEARRAVRQALDQRPDDPQLLHQAAMVHSILGDLERAGSYAKAALDRGVQPRWFAATAFDPLRREAGFRALIEDSGR